MHFGKTSATIQDSVLAYASILTSWACLLYVITAVSPSIAPLITPTVCLRKSARGKATATETSFRTAGGNYGIKKLPYKARIRENAVFGCAN